MMTAEEIVREYRLAKSPRKQIEILADLNGVKKAIIAKILMENGCEVPKYYLPTPQTEMVPAEEPKEAGPVQEFLVVPEEEPAPRLMELEELLDAFNEIGVPRGAIVTVNGKPITGIRLTADFDVNKKLGVEYRVELTI